MSSEYRGYSPKISSISYFQEGTTFIPMMAYFKLLASIQPFVDRKDHRSQTRYTPSTRLARENLLRFSLTSTKKLEAAVYMLSNKGFSSGRLGSIGSLRLTALLVVQAIRQPLVIMLRPGIHGLEPTILLSQGSNIMAEDLSSCLGITTTEPSPKL